MLWVSLSAVLSKRGTVDESVGASGKYGSIDSSTNHPATKLKLKYSVHVTLDSLCKEMVFRIGDRGWEVTGDSSVTSSERHDDGIRGVKATKRSFEIDPK